MCKSDRPGNTPPPEIQSKAQYRECQKKQEEELRWKRNPNTGAYSGIPQSKVIGVFFQRGEANDHYKQALKRVQNGGEVRDHRVLNPRYYDQWWVSWYGKVDRIPGANKAFMDGTWGQKHKKFSCRNYRKDANTPYGDPETQERTRRIAESFCEALKKFKVRISIFGLYIGEFSSSGLVIDTKSLWKKNEPNELFDIWIC